MDNMRLEIDGEHAGVKFSACHFIAGHEKCGRLHGHSYVVSMGQWLSLPMVLIGCYLLFKGKKS